MSSCVPPGPARLALARVRARSAGAPLASGSPVTLHFHPDRPVRGLPILRAMARDGVYASQFVTGVGNGGLTAHPGGDRLRWESRLFAGAYDAAPAWQRPVYGALDDRRRAVGGAPRFGSAHFRLRAAALARTTFCYPDSSCEPDAVGVADRMPLVALAEADRRAGRRDALDDYVEAHVHGPVRLDRDVAALVLDPSHRGTEVEEAARALPCAVEWHTGFRLRADELAAHAEYRGRECVDLGRRVAEAGRLDPRVLGEAVRRGHHDPRVLKWLWHCLARFGAPDAR